MHERSRWRLRWAETAEEHLLGEGDIVSLRQQAEVCVSDGELVLETLGRGAAWFRRAPSVAAVAVTNEDESDELVLRLDETPPATQRARVPATRSIEQGLVAPQCTQSSSVAGQERTGTLNQRGLTRTCGGRSLRRARRTRPWTSTTAREGGPQ